MASHNKLRIAAWTAYGAGSSGYVLMIPAIGYAAYFHSQVAGNDARASTLWAVAVASALIVTGLVAPLLGAFVDGSGRRRSVLALATLISCLLTASLALVGPGDVLAGMLLFVGAHASFLLAKALYDSYLPELGAPSALSIISGLGWGLGYAGSIACFLLCLPFIQGGSEGHAPETFRLAFLVTAVFFACLSLPSILLLDRAGANATSRNAPRVFARVRETLGQWREHREVWKFLLAFYVINDAIVTVLFFIGIFFKVTFGLTVEQILWLTLLFYAVGIPSTISFGWLGRVWSERGALYITLLIWLALLGTMALGENPSIPLIVVLMAGLVIGSSQALCRSMYARMIPRGRSSEFFGFNALVGRASAALGPLTFGLVTAATGSQRVAMASLAGYIIVGAILLAFHRPVGGLSNVATPQPGYPG